MSLRSMASALARYSRGLGAVDAAAGIPVRDRSAPLDAVAAAWPELVGADVARHCAPLELSGTTLIVATGSSAWSQQLQFLEPRVLEGVRAIPSAAHVTKLRFRSGGLAPRARAVAIGRTTAVRRKTTAAPYEPARDLDEALSRLKARFGASKDTARRCARCATTLRERPAAATQCAPCEEETARERQHHAQRLLYDTPWLGRDAVLDSVPELTHDEYDRARRTLLTRWWATLERARRSKRLSKDGLERRIASSYVILQSRLPPDRMSPAIVRNTLGEELTTLLFGAAEGERSDPREASRTEKRPSAAKTSRRE